MKLFADRSNLLLFDVHEKSHPFFIRFDEPLPVTFRSESGDLQARISAQDLKNFCLRFIEFIEDTIGYEPGRLGKVRRDSLLRAMMPNNPVEQSTSVMQ